MTAGFLAYRDLDEVMGLTTRASAALKEWRTGTNIQHSMVALLRQSIYSRLAGYDDPHDATNRFDFVLANPPFNVNAVDKERLKDHVGPGRRFPFGLPRTDNANYIWIQIFYSALNPNGRSGFVMANSASDARSSEQDIHQKLIESHSVDVMVTARAIYGLGGSICWTQPHCNFGYCIGNSAL